MNPKEGPIRTDSRTINGHMLIDVLVSNYHEGLDHHGYIGILPHARYVGSDSILDPERRRSAIMVSTVRQVGAQLQPNGRCRIDMIIISGGAKRTFAGLEVDTIPDPTMGAGKFIIGQDVLQYGRIDLIDNGERFLLRLCYHTDPNCEHKQDEDHSFIAASYLVDHRITEYEVEEELVSVLSPEYLTTSGSLGWKGIARADDPADEVARITVALHTSANANGLPALKASHEATYSIPKEVLRKTPKNFWVTEVIQNAIDNLQLDLSERISGSKIKDFRLPGHDDSANWFADIVIVRHPNTVAV